MHGPVSPLTQYIFMVWCLVKDRDNFTFTFTGTTLHFTFSIYASENCEVADWEVTILHRKNQHVMKCYTGPRTWTDFLELPRQWKMGLDRRIILEWMLKN
jgi:hypothetical protein